MIKIRPITNVIGILLVIVGFLMLSCLGFSYSFQSGDAPALIKSGLITIGCGLALALFRYKGSTSINKREGYLIVAFGWLSMVFFGMLPYLFSPVNPGFINALFETASGLTTTGATIFPDIESLPEGILFWRSLTQWIGGMGIIVLTVAIFPLLGIAGIELFVAEAPGPTSDKLHPRIKETAKRLWLIYVGLTAVLIIALRLWGMSFYDAINHGLTTMATGGFSTKNNSMAYFGAGIQYTVILFMFIAGTNYTIIYYSLNARFRKVWASDEFRAYVKVVLLFAFAVTLTLAFRGEPNLEISFRKALFQVVSIMTTTGYITADYTTWGHGLTMFFFILLFCGASAGSTSGGIKLVRHLVFFKNSILEFKRILHPRAMVRLKINNEIVAARILTHILVFLLLYLAIFLIGTIVVSGIGMDFISASGAVATSLGNVGPAIGMVGPAENFASVPAPAKIVLSFLMLLGRLELFTIIVLFTGYFWKKN
jgi:trk system potassium uptake protein TrkH